MQIVTLFETHSLKLIFFCTTTFSFILSSFFSSLFSSILSPLLQVEIFLLFVSLYRQLITFQLFHYFFRNVSVYKICSFISSRSISEWHYILLDPRIISPPLRSKTVVESAYELTRVFIRGISSFKSRAKGPAGKHVTRSLTLKPLELDRVNLEP